jgi:hypothetical protein
MGIQGGGRGVGRRRQVEEVEFLSKRDKWIGWDSLQEETSGRGAIPPNIVLLCANCCVQRRGEVSDVEGYLSEFDGVMRDIEKRGHNMVEVERAMFMLCGILEEWSFLRS